MTKEACCPLIPLACRSMVINTLLEPEGNSLMITSHFSSYSYFCSWQRQWSLRFCIFLVDQWAFLQVLMKMTACVMVKVLFKSHSESDFHFSHSTLMWTWWIPSRVNSSFLTRLWTESLMNFLVTSSTLEGIVADSRTTWVLLLSFWNMS